jgi:hypothetical protein
MLQSEPGHSARCTAHHSVAKRVCPHCYKSVCAYMLQSEPYSARGHFCQCCKACVSTLLQKCLCLHVAVGAVQCPGPLLRVCPHCCKSVCAYMLQSESYSARGHLCQCCKACVSHIVANMYGPMYMLQSEPYSARGHFCQCCKACVFTLLQKCLCLHVAVRAVQCQGPLLPVLQSVCVHIVAKVFVPSCCSRSHTVPGATSASVAKRVCPHCCKSVCAYILQSEPYSARGHFCQVVCDYGMVLIWAIHESKVR